MPVMVWTAPNAATIVARLLRAVCLQRVYSTFVVGHRRRLRICMRQSTLGPISRNKSSAETDQCEDCRKKVRTNFHHPSLSLDRAAESSGAVVKQLDYKVEWIAGSRAELAAHRRKLGVRDDEVMAVRDLVDDAQILNQPRARQ